MNGCIKYCTEKSNYQCLTVKQDRYFEKRYHGGQPWALVYLVFSLKIWMIKQRVRIQIRT